MPLSERQKQYLDLMGIPVYTERAEEEKQDFELPPQVKSSQKKSPGKSDDNLSPVNDSQAREAPTVTPAETETSVSVHEILKRSDLPQEWSGLIDHVSNCERCDLHKTRTQTVFGVGDSNADWMIIGEAPGVEEDKQGEPFVGQAGQLLTVILESIGLGRDKVYIANTLKCRPPGNRDPKKSEAAQCRAYLEQQIALVDPKIIICVGRIASQNVLQVEDPISRMRGKPHSIQHPVKLEKDIPVIVTYHPAYLLRSPSQKRKVWDDLKLAFSVLKA
ncbi:MAG: uracil-DNA glycosylase [Gammaproteobacteria bacterium]|nr:uracil-DNA glycosylase [Gammaproteobacteria bacterium]